VNVARAPLDGEGPAFREPWEAQIFALVLALHEAGVFTWSEWTAVLSRRVAAPHSAETDVGGYGRWLAALESLLIERDIASAEALTARKNAWARAAEATPHGTPILLANDPQASAR
jgi:nitrile hydratase accessory protein